MVLSCFHCRDSKQGGAVFQDKQYGKGLRVHNTVTKKRSLAQTYRCTICGWEREADK